MLSAAPLAGAQVTLNLTTTQNTNCTATTDTQGLQLVPGGTDLKATGVTLTGSGCGGASDFQAAIQVPGTAVAGTAFTVNWSAAAAATQCTYGGTNGMAGWPVGTNACQGAACNSPHTAQVTVPNAGTYSLNVTCTNTSGFATGSGTATAPQQPPQPASFALTAPATANVGTAFPVSWAVTGASACTGSASLNGSSANLPGWTDTTSPTSPRSVTPAVAGTYSLTLNCTNSVPGSAQSTAASVAVTGTGGSCLANRQTIANVCYQNYNAPAQCTQNVDITTLDSIFGHLAAGDTLVPMPWNQGYVTLGNWNTAQIIAAQFTVPASGLPSTQTGFFTHGETMKGVQGVDMSISTTCGDFAPGGICQNANVSGGQIGMAWKVPTAAGTAYCTVTPGQTYYLNIRATTPVQYAVGDCSNGICRASFNNNHN
ncbi:hypothetical protein GCM10009105_18630 [Dokdonella soli]|uniref:Ig-like domain-containing protein n=1 Tax=Dokdonella soli TaxID=529810 RepID=A0ABN1II65_9GAMM